MGRESSYSRGRRRRKRSRDRSRSRRRRERIRKRHRYRSSSRSYSRSRSRSRRARSALVSRSRTPPARDRDVRRKFKDKTRDLSRSPAHKPSTPDDGKRNQRSTEPSKKIEFFKHTKPGQAPAAPPPAPIKKKEPTEKQKTLAFEQRLIDEELGRRMEVKIEAGFQRKLQSEEFKDTLKQHLDKARRALDEKLDFEVQKEQERLEAIAKKHVEMMKKREEELAEKEKEARAAAIDEAKKQRLREQDEEEKRLIALEKKAEELAEAAAAKKKAAKALGSETGPSSAPKKIAFSLKAKIF